MKRLEQLAEECAKSQGLPASKHEWMASGGSTLDYQVFDSVAQAYEDGFRAARAMAVKALEARYRDANLGWLEAFVHAQADIERLGEEET